MQNLRVFEAFSGYGSQSLALERLNIPFEVVGISEIDSNAIKAYYTLHNSTIPNYGDISKIDPILLNSIDLFTYSFPCTDLSLSGKLAGMARGKTRSGLLYECEKIIEVVKPKYLLMENVPNLLGPRFKCHLDDWVSYLGTLGYVSTYKILNAVDSGIPQNRKRLFCVSILSSNPFSFTTSKIIPLDLISILNTDVSEKYFIKTKYSTPYKENIVGAIRGRYNEEDKIVQQLEFRKDNFSNTLTTVKKDNVIVQNGNLRYFTENECFKLMGLSDDEIYKLNTSSISMSSKYKLAGNSIVIPVLCDIFRELFKEYIK